MCDVYAYDKETEKRYKMVELQHHTHMGKWLKVKGDKKVVYEVHKPTGLHSRWIWKEKKNRWGRTATPPKNE